MPQTSVSALLSLLRFTVGQQPDPAPPDPLDDVDRAAPDQQAARDQVLSILVLRSRLDRAAVLGAVRHELRLPLGADTVPAGALHLIRADESSVTVGSRSRAGTHFRTELTVVDHPAGSIARHRVTSWHQHGGSICGLQQQLHLRRAVIRGVRSVDAGVQVVDQATR